MNGKIMSKYLDFQLVEKKPKTVVYNIVSKHHGNVLGRIYWYGPWRQYVFHPALETIWNKDCMADVQNFIFDLMLARKEARISVGRKG